METNVLYNQDCLVGLKDLPDESIDLVATDCPYHIVHNGTSMGGGIFADDRNEYARTGKLFAHNDIAFSEWLPDIYRVLKKGTHCYIMINSRNLCELQTEAERVGFVFQNLLVWNKGNATPNKYYMQALEFILMLSKRPARDINDMGAKNLLTVPNIVGKKAHPTEKPVALMAEMIRNSTNAGDIILDPFAGAGATLLAAQRLGRHYIGFEIDPQYYTIAHHRLYQEPKQQVLFA